MQAVFEKGPLAPYRKRILSCHSTFYQPSITTCIEYMCIFTYTYVTLCIYVGMFVSASISIHASIHIYIYAYMYVYICTYVYTYIHMYVVLSFFHSASTPWWRNPAKYGEPLGAGPVSQILGTLFKAETAKAMVKTSIEKGYC